MKMNEKIKDLRSRLPESEIEWRVQQYGHGSQGWWAKLVPYPDARYLMGRLDQVLRPDGWQTQVESAEGGIITCGLALWFGDERGWIWRWDAADPTDIGGAKGGVTHAFRRTCTQWNIADIQFLYQIDGPVWANVHEDGSHRTYDKDRGEEFFWDPPPLSEAVKEGDGRNEAIDTEKIGNLFKRLCESDEEARETVAQIATWRAAAHEDFPADWPGSWVEADYSRLLEKLREAGNGDLEIGAQKMALQAAEWAKGE